MSIRPSVGPSVRRSVCPSVRQSVCPSVGLSVCPSVCPSVGLSICFQLFLNDECGCFLNDNEVAGSDGPPRTTEFPFFLTFAVPTAFRDPFFLVPCEFLHAFHWVPYKEMKCLGASMSKKH